MSIDFPNLNSIEEFYQEKVEGAGPFADFIEAKETWWEYSDWISHEIANEASEKEIPPEIYALTNSWM